MRLRGRENFTRAALCPLKTNACADCAENDRQTSRFRKSVLLRNVGPTGQIIVQPRVDRAGKNPVIIRRTHLVDQNPQRDQTLRTDDPEQIHMTGRDPKSAIREKRKRPHQFGRPTNAEHVAEQEKVQHDEQQQPRKSTRCVDRCQRHHHRQQHDKRINER